METWLIVCLCVLGYFSVGLAALALFIRVGGVTTADASGIHLAGLVFLLWPLVVPLFGVLSLVEFLCKVINGR